jgi:hypothetical protein
MFAAGKTFARMRSSCTRVFILMREALREIFDEAAYARYLVRHHATNSTDAYSAFLRESENARAKKARCC